MSDSPLASLTGRRESVSTLALGVASFLVGGGILAAYLHPARGYELSVYAATPVIFWVAVGLAVAIALAVAVYAPRDRLQTLSLVVAGTGVVAIVALPVIRNYYYYGRADSLKHLGFVRGIAAGAGGLLDLIYPAFHGFAITLTELSGFPLRRSMLLTVVVLSVVFFVFLPLSVHALFRNRRMTAITGVSGFLLLPINNVSTSLTFHPFSLAALFSPVVLYFLFRHLKGDTVDRSLPGTLSIAGLALLLTGSVLILFHPQLAFDVMVLFGAVVAIQLVYRFLRPTHPLASTRGLYAQFLFLAVLFYLWNTQHWKFAASVQHNIQAFYGLLEGTQQVGSDVTNRAASANQIGVDPVVLGLKVFAVSGVYAALSAGLVLVHLVTGSRASTDTEDNILVTYFTVGGVILSPYLFLQFIGTLSNHFFRHLGFIMVIGALMGSVALSRWWDWLSARAGVASRYARHLVVPGALVVLILSVAVFYPSPYFFKSSGHVSEQYMAGYEASFASQPPDADVPFTGIGIGPVREEIALTSAPSAPWDAVVSPIPTLSGSVPPDNMTALVAYYSSHPREDRQRDHYLPVTTSDWESEVIATDGLRYSRADFASLDRQPGVYRVRSNGDFTLYYVDIES